MSDDLQSPEFRQRVLDSLRGERTLEDVAREFGLPADLVFSWVGEGVANGTLHPDAANSVAGASRRNDAITGPRRPSPETDTIFQAPKHGLRKPLLIALFVGVFALLVLSLSIIGRFHDSREYWRASWRGWAVVAVVIATVLYPLFSRSPLSKTGSELRASVMAALVPSALTGIALSGLYAFFVPYLMHRFERQPVQIETTVIRRGVSDGRGGHCLYLDTAVSRRYVTILFCVDQGTYDKAHFGEKIRIDGLESWYGLEFKGYAILDT